MSFYREVCRAMCHIERHVDNLMDDQQELDEEYESLFESLLDKAQDFDEGAMVDFRKLGNLRRLRTLNLTTIMSLQYLRLCIWLMMDGMEPETELDPSQAIKRLRSVNDALAGPSSSQVRRLREALERTVGRPVDCSTRYSKAIGFALASVDNDVAKIFGEAMSVCAPQPTSRRG